MSGLSLSIDESVPVNIQGSIRFMVDNINSSLSVRSVDVKITANIGDLPGGFDFDSLEDIANYTFSNVVKNDTIFVNTSFDYQSSLTSSLQSLMHELTHVAFPGVAKGTFAHSEEFYEKLAIVSDAVGIKFSASDLGKWKDALRQMGLPEDSIEAITEDYADTDAYKDTHCFLADTPVLMADGSEKPIQEIKPGDFVMAFDPKANDGLGARRAARVKRTFTNTARQILNLRGLRMTPGHVVLSDKGEWLKVMEVLRHDRALVEERGTGPVLVRARTGAVVGSEEDIPVTVVFKDRTGMLHRATVRAGIVCIAERRADGTRKGWSLARVLRHQNYTITPNGTLTGSDGRRYDATPWPDGTPFDAPFQHDWVVSLDGMPFVPAWIRDVREEDDEAEAVIGEASFSFRPSFMAGLNRRDRRRRAALRAV